jgi:ribosomal protein S18 acetylase RimI-like enzyme
VSGVQFPAGWRIELLAKSHRRQEFDSGNPSVNDWLRKTALQSQSKHLTSTKVLLSDTLQIVGYYTLATSQVDFADLPADLAHSLPRRQLPVAVIAWIGVDVTFQAQGVGKRLLATALRDCYEAGETFAFIAVILDCIDQAAKDFYQRFDFAELPGYPMRLYLSHQQLQRMMRA